MAKRNTDTVPAMLTPGEFVIKKESAQKIGYDKLKKMNKTEKILEYTLQGLILSTMSLLGVFTYQIFYGVYYVEYSNAFIVSGVLMILNILIFIYNKEINNAE